MRMQAKFASLLLVVFGLLASVPTAAADPVKFNLSNWIGAAINFDGNGNITFTDGSGGRDFIVTSGSMSGLAGLKGNIGGTFTIGDPAGGSAPVTTADGVFSIWDGASLFSAQLDLVNIIEIGAGTGLNSAGTVNLTNFSYGGTNLALQKLLQAEAAVAKFTFQFTSPATIDFLKTTATSTTYSATITAVPEPSSLVLLLGVGLAGLGIARRMRLE